MSYVSLSGFSSGCMVVGFAMQLVCAAATNALGQNDGARTSRADDSLVLKLSLADAIQAALDNNPNVKYYRERIEAARSVSKTQSQRNGSASLGIAASLATVSPFALAIRAACSLPRATALE